jgi:MFS family permease
LFVVCGGGWGAWAGSYPARGRAPLIPLRLFRVSSYRNGTLIMTAYLTALPPVFLLTTLFLQIGLGLSALYAGMVTIGFALASSVASWISGHLVARFGRALVVWGLLGVLASIVGLTAAALYVPPDTVAWVMAGVMVVAGFAGGVVISPNQTLTLEEIPVKRGGLAGSVGQLGQRIGTSIGTAVALSLFYATIYREEGGEASAHVVYHDAYAYGMVACAVFVALAFLLGILDLTARHRRKPTGEVTDRS